MITDLIDTSPEGIELARKFYTLDLQQSANWATDPDSFGGDMTVLIGLNCALYGLVPLARKHLEFAVPMLLGKLVPGVPDIEGGVVPGSAAELQTDTPESMRGKVHVAGGSAVIPFDAFAKSEWWTCLALCRWFLENRHDAESFRHAADEMDRCFAMHHRDVRDPGWMDYQGSVFCAARDYERVIQYFTRHGKKFKPPRRPSDVRSERAMGWMLATHRLRGEWEDEQIAQAWERFLGSQVERLISGGRIAGLATWLKLRFWDTTEGRADPYAAFHRAYEYLPDLRRPPIER